MQVTWLDDSQDLLRVGIFGFFGRSNTREDLRRHFEIDAEQVVISVLSSLAKSGKINNSVVEKAMGEFGIDADAPDPMYQ